MTSLPVRIVEAARDYKYLLNRGYPQKSSLNLVTSRYSLSKHERLLLYRCVHGDDLCNSIKEKIVKPGDIKNERLIIDGYNVLLTVLTGLKGEPLYLCDDGFIRDLRGAQPRSSELGLLSKASNYIKISLTELRPSKVLVILDENVSKSKYHSELITENMISDSYELEVILCKKADKGVLTREKGIISSSDIVILKQAERVFDLAGYTIMKLQRIGYSIKLYELKI